MTLKVISVDTPIWTFGAIPGDLLTRYFNIFFNYELGGFLPILLFNTFKIFCTNIGTSPGPEYGLCLHVI